MTPYTFVTREEIDSCCDLGLKTLCVKLLSERDAYREGGVELLREECEELYGKWGNPDVVEAYEEIDDAARRILEGK